MITIREARPEELADLEALQRRASLANPGDREAILAHPDAIVIPVQQIAHRQVFLAEDDGALLGFSAVLDRDDGQTELDGLFVEPTSWRAGVGRLLVERAKDYARDHSASWLHVVGNPHAEGFYEACGFVTYGSHDTEFGPGLLMRVGVNHRAGGQPRAQDSGMDSSLGYLEALHEYQDAFLGTIPDADPATTVPWCGDWTVEDLIVHLARVHHWAAAQARMVQQAPLGDGPFQLATLYAQCAAELRATLAELDPGARARTLLDDGLPPGEHVGTVRFWHRRQALETLVHTWDLRVACGLDFDPGPAAWLDCFDEVVTIMHPRQIRLGRIKAPATRVRFDVEEGSPVWLHGAPPDAPQISISGPARGLALLAWGRTTPDDPALTVTGDRVALDELLVAGLTP